MICDDGCAIVDLDVLCFVYGCCLLVCGGLLRRAGVWDLVRGISCCFWCLGDFGGLVVIL